jgi:hypothetical protein
MKLKLFAVACATLVLAMMLGFTNCSKKQTAVTQQPDTVRKLAKASDDLSGGIKLAIKTKRDLAQQKVITPEEELALTKFLLDVDRAGEAFNTALVNTQNDSPQARQQLLALLDSVAGAVKSLNDDGVLHIKNGGARQRVALLISGVEAAIASIRVILTTAPAGGQQ